MHQHRLSPHPLFVDHHVSPAFGAPFAHDAPIPADQLRDGRGAASARWVARLGEGPDAFRERIRDDLGRPAPGAAGPGPVIFLYSAAAWWTHRGLVDPPPVEPNDADAA